MNAIERDQAIGRRLARNGLSVSRSTRAPYPWERRQHYRAVSAAINPDLYCTVAGVQPARSATPSPGTTHLATPRLPATGQQALLETPGNVAISSALRHRATDSRERPAPTPTTRAKRRRGKA